MLKLFGILHKIFALRFIKELLFPVIWYIYHLKPPVYNRNRYYLQKHHANFISANPAKWSNIQTIRRLLPTNYVSLFVHFVGFELKGLKFDLVFWQCCSCGTGANYANTQDFWNNFNNKTLFYRRITGNCW